MPQVDSVAAAGKPVGGDHPPAELLLVVDRIYRRQCDTDELPRIAPRLNNPSGQAWLPVLHTRQGHWHFTAMFSNTERAHRLGRVRDWVVIHYHQDGQPAGHCTVVTEHRGHGCGQRVVRGRQLSKSNH